MDQQLATQVAHISVCPRSDAQLICSVLIFMLGQASLSACSIQMLRFAGKAKTEHMAKCKCWTPSGSGFHLLACISCVRHVSC